MIMLACSYIMCFHGTPVMSFLIFKLLLYKRLFKYVLLHMLMVKWV
jgi:hypothetical protein